MEDLFIELLDKPISSVFLLPPENKLQSQLFNAISSMLKDTARMTKLINALDKIVLKENRDSFYKIQNYIDKLNRIPVEKFDYIRNHMLEHQDEIMVYQFIAIMYLANEDTATFAKFVDFSVNSTTTTMKPIIINDWEKIPKPKEDEILIPNNFKPRDYQIDVLKEIDSHRYNCIVQSRQSGKDMTCFAWIVREAFKRTGNFYYVGLDNAEIRRVIWDKRMPDGTKLTDMCPRQFSKVNSQSMTIEIATTGSMIQCIGLYENDNLVGTSGTYVLTEAAKQDPQAIGYLIPIVSNKDNIGGKLILNSTVRGKNHFYRTYLSSIESPNWGSKYIKADETGQYTDSELEDIRQWYINTYMSDSLFKQEYMLDWTSSNMGAVYAEWLEKARSEDRVGGFYYTQNRPVFASMDIGVGDATAVVVYQLIGDQIKIIDSFENTGKAVNHYIDLLKNAEYYKDLHAIYLPHDGANREWGKSDTDGNAISRLETTRQVLGDNSIDVRVLPKEKIETQINLVRNYFYRFCFNENTSKRLLDCIDDLKYKYNDKLQTSTSREPEHNWSRHMCDALSYMCQSIALGYAKGESILNKNYINKSRKKREYKV